MVLEVLDEAVGTSETLTAGEQEFLITYAGATRGDFTVEAENLTRMEITKRQVAAARQAWSTAWTTSEVAGSLGRAPSNVRRSLSTGNLYSVGSAATNRERLFPQWQFSGDGRILPGLRQVVEALPADYHPLDIEDFMVGAHERLRGRSPVSWLADGGDVETVVEIADELGWV